MYRMPRVALWMLIVVVASSSVFAQGERSSERAQNDPVSLKDWTVPYETIKRMDTATRLLHPEVTAVPSAASHFVTVIPCRVTDTRNTGTPLAPNSTTTINVVGSGCGIPSGAAAYSMNFTAMNPNDNGYVTAYPTGTVRPTTATLSFLVGGPAFNNSAIVPAGTNGSIDVFVAAQLHMIIDINGYFVEGVVTSLTAGTGLTGGGTGPVTLGLAPGGVGSTQLGANAVTTGAIANGTITAAKIASAQVVKTLNGVSDAITVTGSSGVTVTTNRSNINITASAPSGSMLLGFPDDTTLIGAGYTELGPGMQDAWRTTSLTNAPAARYLHTGVWTGNRLIVWGGGSGSATLNSGGIYDPVTDSWTSTSIPGAPSARSRHTAVWTGSKMIVWGGSFGLTALNTGGVYDPAANSWTATNSSGAPSARGLHTAVWTGTYMIVWGGGDSSALVNTGGRYRPAQDDWLPVTTRAAPAAREEHTAVWATTTSQMIVWGGDRSITQDENTGGLYDPVADTWTPTNLTGAPAARTYHGAVWAGSKMVVWGGSDGNYLDTGGMYDPGADSWTAMSTAGAPTPRTIASIVWTGQKVVVWSGVGEPQPYETTGGLFDPAKNAWGAPLTMSNVPFGRSSLCTVWTGNRMIVWGGQLSDGSATNTGGQWAFLSLYQKN